MWTRCAGENENDAKTGKTYRGRKTAQNGAAAEVSDSRNAHGREHRRNIVATEKQHNVIDSVS
jgi:hypothetical protein